MTTSDPLVGHVLDGRYEMLRRLARGGMATVYLADDRRLTRTVAVKVMHEGLGDDHDFIRKFDREARAAARLSHPNIVGVFDQGLDRGRPYIVMEYVEGCTLRNIITREAPMDPLRTLDLMLPVVDALAAAHDAGLVHLDIKPENVLISDRGQVKVADFGLARAVTGQTATATQGLLIGTVSYIAPELVTQGKPSPRCDVYGVGIVLYEMLTGHKPHTGDTPIQVAYSHVHNQVPPPSADVSTSWRDDRSGIPPYLDALVTTAAGRLLADRPVDARVLLGHMRLAREALANSVMDDPDLTAQMRQTVGDPGALVTTPVPLVQHSAEDTPKDPIVPSVVSPVTRTIRLTASTPVSPNLPMDTDGIPYYDDAPPELIAEPTPVVKRAPVAKRPPAQPRVHRRRIVVLLLVVLLALGGGTGAWWWFEGRWTTTPTFAGQTQQAATDAATQAGLLITFEPTFSEDVPAGQVIGTDPAPGARILPGGTVAAQLSKGPERYNVPIVVGTTQEAAVRELTTAHLAAGTVTGDYSDTIPAGTIISASIPAGTPVKPGTTVDLTVSKGPAPVDIADFTGQAFADVKAQLEAQGLKVVESGQENHASIPAGGIISQTPGAGTVHRGDTISFVTSKGPVMVTVPNVFMMTPSAASAELKKVGFAVKIVYDNPNGFNRALSTDPAAGTQAPEGSTITIHIA